MSRGIRTKDHPGRGAAWTPEEDAILKDLCAPGKTSGCTQEATDTLGRSRLAVSLRMHSLGLVDRHRPRSLLQIQHVSKEADKRRGKGKLASMDEEAARKLFERFKKSKQAMGRFSRGVGFNADGLSKLFRKFFSDEYDLIQEHKWSRRDLWYRKGRAFEYRVRDFLRSCGWWVLRSPQSKSPVDLVALKPGRVLMVQCKSGSGLSTDERQTLFDLASSVSAIPILADRKNSRGTRFMRIGRRPGEYFDDVEF